MKKLFRGAMHRIGNHFATQQALIRSGYNAKMIIGTFILGALLLTGCKKESKELPNAAFQSQNEIAAHSLGNVVNDYTGLSPQTLWELQQARAATARYRDIRNAIKDGYADISVVVPNMGHHYMKLSLVDGSFEIRKPEILVYNQDENGDFTLVAVEYAVPIDLTPDTAPAGFTGSNDVWDRNTGFGLWLLHAWVWNYNPLGVFNPTNPLVHTH